MTLMMPKLLVLQNGSGNRNLNDIVALQTKDPLYSTRRLSQDNQNLYYLLKGNQNLLKGLVLHLYYYF